MLKTICIGVPTYKRPDNLKDLLARLTPLLRPHIRLRIVNDGSHDAEYERIVAPYSERIEYRILPENGGCGAARRACFEDATEDYLVCIDDDCVPTGNWLDWLEALIEANPGVDLFAGDVRPFFARPPNAFTRALSVIDDAPSPLVNGYGLLTAVTANLAMKRSAYEAVGGFDPALRGTEDCDITQKLLNGGAAYLISLDWVIEHIAKSSYFEMRKRFRGYGVNGARFVVARQNWRHSSLQNGGSFREIREIVVIQFRREYASAANRNMPRPEKFLRAVTRALLMLEYCLGWRAGLREHGIRTKDELPRPPALADSYVDFTKEDATALNLR
ncbi:MAG: glycosyltransferase family 2 protein [Parvibaculum sp.]|uniref:glycosyltransferase family 2 protein n=1 Tax=Parvibaculum sp. TaxID=2024848 RepID=UPI0025CF23A8|nr:glycosyltransferase family A protein [Parvibaculum sp.]MCE9650259.1 glycosyltransferase family 2 protein [Parvibaculum sp.]